MLRQTLLVIAGLVSASQAYAQDERWFEVEVYLFERNNSQSQEAVPEHVSIKQPKKLVDLISPIFSTNITGASLSLEGCSSHDWVTNADMCNEQLKSAQMDHPSHIPVNIAAASEQYGVPYGPAVLLGTNQNQFTDLINKLSREKGNKSLLHMTWQQSMLPRHRAKAVRLFSGQDYSSRFKLNGQSVSSQKPETDIPQFDFLSSFSTEESKPVWKLDGSLNIYLDHYLYVETALNLREEGTKKLAVMRGHNPFKYSEADLSTPFLYAIPMKQNRRVRSDEIHYFDHPKMGMVLQIRKMQQPIDREKVPATEPL
ncbi:peptidoglycan binding protein CsiV [Shewanella eurypsychrophilus]|uniref:Peptidoglycan binding protein CsiV n=1 Tax=Shewanella eurypsychrophilus TaxID=2593656 RepID=A0ABX6V4P3_9GAMM|nr:MULTISPECIES: peptidoglycan binding protein CsiV [Shewanella]QFU22293.1 hypothetical protein FS418_10650 [Shewanella sp. YLB-09]QPG57579.1 peptidoglycan binding protein CsiV [Shewanella eurypsychrophilus]